MKAGVSGISRVAIVVIIIVIIVVAGVGALTLSGAKSTTTTSPPTSSVVSSSSAVTSSAMSSTPSTSSSSATSTASQTSPNNQTLSIDSDNWPLGSINQLLAFSASVYPDWAAFTDFQPLVDLNVTAEFPGGAIQFLPDLAQNWTVSANGSLYTFNLRQNVNFTNGDPLNAYEVWASFYAAYYLSGNASSWYNGYLVFNMNPVEFGPATQTLLNQSGGLNNPSPQALAVMENSSWPIYVVNQTTINFQLVNSFPWFLGTLPSLIGQVYDVNFVLQHGGFGTPTSINTYFNLNPIPGTGPYYISDVANEQYVEFTQNPNYWGKNLTAAQIAANPLISPGQAKNVILYAKTDDSVRYLDLSTGAVQISNIGPGNWQTILGNPQKYSYLSMPSDSGLVAAETLNTQLYPTNITDVRLAIVHAVNMTDVIAKSYLAGTQIVGPEYPAWPQFYDLGNFTPYSYNLTLARQYLAEAGFPNGTGLPPINYTIDTCSYCATRAEVIESDLQQIGITVTINQLTGDNWCAIACQSYSGYESELGAVGNIEDIGGNNWGPTFLSPAEYWVAFVSNTSAYGDTALWATPTSNGCAASFFNGSSIATIQSICGQAQSELQASGAYFGWVSLKYFHGASSTAWLNSDIKSVYFDPLWTGITTDPVFNTVEFA
jgi:peptide/nickel transport system substrate-binding protein